VNICDVLPPFDSIFDFLIHFLINADFPKIFKNDVSTLKAFVVCIMSAVLTACKAVLVSIVFAAVSATLEAVVRGHLSLITKSSSVLPEVFDEIESFVA